MAVPCRHPQVVVRYDANLPQGGHGSSARADANLPQIRVENGGARRRTMCAIMLKDRDRHRKDRLNYHCRNRASFDLLFLHRTYIHPQ